MVVVADNLMDTLCTKVGTPDPMIEAGRQERRFVLHIVIAFPEKEVETFPELLFAPARLNQSGHIVRDVE